MVKEISFKNRSRIEIVYDIVNSAREQPCLKNVLLHKSRVSYFLLKKYLDLVMSQGLFEERIVDESKIYLITPKGFKFLELYEELQSIVTSDHDMHLQVEAN
jgi:predicted transcriptional regulator